jgi:hypothetical protein
MLNFSPAALFIGIFAGICGMAYFAYGKKQARMVPMLSGVLLCVYPYFFDSVWWLVLVGLALLAAPFVIDF